MSATKPARRVLVVGLDGATLTLVRPWAEQGLLPNLGRLMACGTWGVLRSTIPPLTPPAWTTFATGTNPGKHGLFAFHDLRPGAYTNPLITANAIRTATLWELASQAGLRVGVMGMPPSYPLRPVNGFAVSCMLTPPGEKQIVYPPELGAELDGYRIGADPALRPLPGPSYPERALRFIREWRAVTAGRVVAALRLASRHPCELLAVVFYTPDRLQHYFWAFLDPSNPGSEAREAPLLRAEVQESFRQLDEAVGTLVKAAGDDAVTVVLSDHGFGPAPKQTVQVNRWLASRGLLAVRRHWRLRRWAVHRLPRSRRGRWNTVDTIMIRRDRTRAWAEFMESRTVGVWIHEGGRYPLGVVAPGAELEALRDEIRRGLLGLRSPDGRAPFVAVEPREAIYHGPATEAAPELIGILAPEFGVRRDGIKGDVKTPSLFAPYSCSGYTGTHDPAGLYILAGPQVRPAGEAPEAGIQDLAPTILCLLGLPIPAGLDGRVLSAALRPEFLAASPPRLGSPAEARPAARGPGWLSAEDERQVEQRLRALGYVE